MGRYVFLCMFAEIGIFGLSYYYFYKKWGLHRPESEFPTMWNGDGSKLEYKMEAFAGAVLITIAANVVLFVGFPILSLLIVNF